MSRTLSAMGTRSSRHRRWRGALVIATLAAVGLGTAGPTAVAHSVAPKPDAAPSTSAAPAPANRDTSSGKPSGHQDTSGATAAESTALTQARATGKPVEVAGQVTETTTVLANPDGKFTMRSNVRPVRVKRDGAWRDIDTTLTRRADGALVPTAAAVNVAFSGGGTAPLVALAEADKTFSLSWPAPLPAPVITGNTATYPSVLPGVDLRVSANSDSYSEVLVVHDAEAAMNPALAAIKLPVATTGLTLDAAQDGALTAKDAAGKVVFAGGVPIMWDSTRDEQVGPAPTAENRGSGRMSALKVVATPTSSASVAPAAGAASTVELTLTPEPAALAGADVRYPVYIDPWMGRSQEAWAEITSTDYHYFNDPNQEAQVGFCDWGAECGPRSFVARSYFQIPTQPLQARNGRTAVIYTADFWAIQLHGANLCTPQPVDLHETAAIGPGTRWNPGVGGFFIDQASSGAGNQCNSAPHDVRFNAFRGVQDAVNGNWPNLTLGLLSPNEGNRLLWKRFANNPHLDVTFNFPPNPASGLHVSNEINCNGRVITPDAFPTLFATATDNNDPPLELGLSFELYDAAGVKRAFNPVGVNIAPGTVGGWPDDVDLGNGDYNFRVAVENHTGGVGQNLWAGTWSSYSFVARSIAPSQKPTITSFDYPRDNWGFSSQVPGKFTFNANGAPNVVGFTYTFVGAGTEYVPTSQDCFAPGSSYSTTNGGWVASNGTATITVPVGMKPGPYNMYVRTIDEGHNLSPESQQYTFYVSNDYAGMPVQRIEAETSGATQPAGQNIPLGPQADCCGVGWSSGQQLLFQADKPNVSFDLTFPAAGEADYALGAGLTKATDYGKLTFLLDGKPLINSDTPAKQWDGYSSGPNATTAFLSFGGAHLTNGTHTLTVKVVGTNPASTGKKYMAGIDYLLVVPVNNFTAASFVDAMNNHGISADGTKGNFDLMSYALSAQTLAAAGLAPGKSVTISGATFTMPTPRADGNDNVIATGQTIPLPTAPINHQIKASALGLLVASTCGDTPPTDFTITYKEPGVSTPPAPNVPDWFGGPSEWATTLVMPYFNTATATSTSVQPKIYAIFLPTDPRKTLQSVTLPNIGTTFLPPPAFCPTPALHVLAMAPRPVEGWVGAWAAPADGAVPPPGGNGFANTTLRTVVKTSATGANTRIRLANPYAGTPVTFDAASIAAQTSTNAAATLAAPTALTFGGATSVTIPAGGEAYSDPVTYPTRTGGSGNLLVSVHLPNAVGQAPVHVSAPGATYLASGNTTTDGTGTPFTTTLTDSYYIAGLDVSTADATQGTVVVLGDQSSAVGAPGAGYRASWVDNLPAKLADPAVGAPVPGGLINASQSGIPAAGAWRLNDGSGTTARDAAGSNNATVTGGVTWSADHGGAAVFNGTTGALTTAGPVLNTTGSYTVSAWVGPLTDTTRFQTIVSQDATQASGFYLQYLADDKKWSFSHAGSDTANPTSLRARSVNPPSVDQPTHLLGTYDATTRTARLYVNGQLEGTVSDVPAFPSTGPLVIGRAKFNGASADFFNGWISDVRVFQRVATAGDANIIFKGGPGYAPQPGLGGFTTFHGGEVLQRAVTSAPNLRTVIMSLGADDILAGTSALDIKKTINLITQPTSPLSFPHILRPDYTPVHIILTTVPPLGLDPSDPRETQRQLLNADILSHRTDYGVDAWIDLDQAVRNPTDKTKLDPSYLTNGATNSAYQDKVTQTMADAIKRLPSFAAL